MEPIVALSEATSMLDVDLTAIRLLNIGTTTALADHPRKLDTAGLGRWARRAPELIMAAGSRGAQGLRSRALRSATEPLTENGEEMTYDPFTRSGVLLAGAEELDPDPARVDGNKRLGWLAPNVLLDMNGQHVQLGEDDAFQLVLAIVEGSLGVEDIADGLIISR